MNKLLGFFISSKCINYFDLKVIIIYLNFILFISYIFVEFELLKIKCCNLRYINFVLVLNKYFVGGIYIFCLISYLNKMYVFYC